MAIIKKRQILLIVFILSFKIAFSQNANGIDSTWHYINKLNWYSFGVTNYVSMPFLRADAEKIIAIADNKKIKKLLRAIKDKEKVVTIHLILTKMYDPDKSGFSYAYHYTGNRVDYTTYTYNGLGWTMKFDNDSCEVDKEQIDNIEKYWRTKLKK
jgi:hypothetical protein